MGQSRISLSLLSLEVLREGITAGETACVPSFANWFFAIKEGDVVR